MITVRTVTEMLHSGLRYGDFNADDFAYMDAPEVIPMGSMVHYDDCDIAQLMSSRDKLGDQ